MNLKWSTTYLLFTVLFSACSASVKFNGRGVSRISQLASSASHSLPDQPPANPSDDDSIPVSVGGGQNKPGDVPVPFHKTPTPQPTVPSEIRTPVSSASPNPVSTVSPNPNPFVQPAPVESPTAAPTAGPTPPPDGGVKLSLDNSPQGHLRVLLPNPLLDGATEYRIYVAEEGMLHDFSKTHAVVPIPGPRNITIGSLKDATRYCVVVRSAKQNADDGTKWFTCERSPVRPISPPLVSALTQVEIDKVLQFHGFTRENISLGEITTVAGRYDDVGSRTSEYAIRQFIRVEYPRGMAVDANDNFYLADMSAQVIRKFDAAGNAGVVAGLPGSQNTLSPDGSISTETTLGNPYSVSIDPAGDLLIVDSFSNRIRKVSKESGIVTTVVGQLGAGSLVGDGGPATSARLHVPLDIAYDAQGNMIIADHRNHAVRKVLRENGSYTTISTIAGTGVPALGADGIATEQPIYHPGDVAVDTDGTIYVSEYGAGAIGGGGRIRKIDTSGQITTLAGTGLIGTKNEFGEYTNIGDNGPASNAKLYQPVGLEIDKTARVLYVSDYGHNRVRKINLTDGTITTFAGSGFSAGLDDNVTAAEAYLRGPANLLLHKGYLYISDQTKKQVYRVNLSTNKLEKFAGTNNHVGNEGDGGDALSAQFNHPHGIAFDKNSDSIFVIDHVNHVLRRINPQGIINRIAGTYFEAPQGGSADGPALSSALRYPVSVTLDKNGAPFIHDYYTHRIRKVTPDEKLQTVVGIASNDGGGARYNGDEKLATEANLYYAGASAFDDLGNLYISDTLNHRVRKVNTLGFISTIAGTGISSQNASAAELGDNGPATLAKLTPTAIAVDASGNVYVGDKYNYKIRKISPNGTITTIAGTGQVGSTGDGGLATAATFGTITALAFSPNNELYIADAVSHTVRKIGSDGVISRVAGREGIGAFSGDGLNALNATLFQPYSLSFDARGNLYIVDRGSYRIRMVKLAW